MRNQDTERDLGLRMGVAVRRYRENAGLTQAALAQRANVAQAEISLIERGKRSKLTTLDRVAQALGRRFSEMVRFAEDVGDTHAVVKEARAFVKQARAQKRANLNLTRSRGVAAIR